MRPVPCITLVLASLFALAATAAISPRSQRSATLEEQPSADQFTLSSHPGADATYQSEENPSNLNSAANNEHRYAHQTELPSKLEEVGEETESRGAPYIHYTNVAQPPMPMGYGPGSGPPYSTGGPTAFGTAGSAFHQPASKLEQVQVSLNCLKRHMEVTLQFPEPFNGIIYPFNQIHRCVLHVGRGEKDVTLAIGAEPCGPLQAPSTPGVIQQYNPFMEHRLMIQWDTDLVLEYDSSILVRCDRPADYNRTIKFDMGTVAGESQKAALGTHTGPKLWMEIQSGEGPTASPLTGPVFLGQTLSLVFTLADDTFNFDSNVLNCWASDGTTTQQLTPYYDPNSAVLPRPFVTTLPVIENSCSVKPKLFGNFQKVRVPHGSMKTTTQWVLFKAFRFPTQSRLLVSCDIQVCHDHCPTLPPCNVPFDPRSAPSGRQRRSTEDSVPTLAEKQNLFRVIEVVSPVDEDGIPLALVNTTATQLLVPASQCLSSATFYGVILALGIALLILIVGAAIYVQRQFKNRSSK